MVIKIVLNAPLATFTNNRSCKNALHFIGGKTDAHAIIRYTALYSKNELIDRADE